MKNKTNLFWGLSLAFCVLLIFSNIIANRLIAPFGVVLPSAVIIFPLTYIIGDVISELFGFAAMRRLIIASLALGLAFAALGFGIASLPAPVFAENAGAFREVFALAPRAAVASVLGFLAGGLSNSWIMNAMKRREKTHGAAGLFLRIITSTVVGELLDSAIFITLAFVGTLAIGEVLVMVVTQAAVKIAYEAVFSPITVGICRKLSATC